jgi:hypothetical protein
MCILCEHEYIGKSLITVFRRKAVADCVVMHYGKSRERFVNHNLKHVVMHYGKSRGLIWILELYTWIHARFCLPSYTLYSILHTLYIMLNLLNLNYVLAQLCC